MPDYDFSQMATLSGIGEGIGEAGESALDSYKEIRRQDQVYQLGMSQVMVQMRRLQEEQRQADMINKRFYNGLKAQDFSQIRDYRQRVSLENLKNTFKMQEEERLKTYEREVAETKQENLMNELNLRGDINKTIAHINTSAERSNARLRFSQYLNAEAMQVVTNGMMISDGPRKGQYMNDTELESYARDVRGQSGEQYKQFLYDQFRKSAIARYGKDKGIPDYASFNEFIKGTQSGDVRQYQQWALGAEQTAMENAIAVDVSSIRNMLTVATGRSDDVPITYDHSVGDFVFATGNHGQSMDQWMRDVLGDHPGDNASSGEIKAWRSRANAAYQNFSEGVSLNDLDQAEKAVLDIVFMQEAEFEGKGSLSLGLSNKSERSLARQREQLKRTLNTGVKPDQGRATSTSNGRTSGQNRVFGDLTFGTQHIVSNMRADFQEALELGNAEGAVRATMSLQNRFDELKSKETPDFLNDAQYKQAQVDLASTLDSMYQDLAAADVSLPPTEGGPGYSSVSSKPKPKPRPVPVKQEGPVPVKQEGLIAEPVTDEEKAEFLKGATTTSGLPEEQLMSVVNDLREEASQRGQPSVFSKENLIEALKEAGASEQQIDAIVNVKFKW